MLKKSYIWELLWIFLVSLLIVSLYWSKQTLNLVFRLRVKGNGKWLMQHGISKLTNLSYTCTLEYEYDLKTYIIKEFIW